MVDSEECLISDELRMVRWGCTHKKRCGICKECHFDSEFQDLCIELHKKVMLSGKFNFEGVRRPVALSLHIEAWRCYLQGFSDAELVEFLKFGWPICVKPSTIMDASHCNHQGAKGFPSEIEEYVQKDIKAGHILGPFKEDPFGGKLHTYPLNTVTKKDSVERRVILDLSFPRGVALNEDVPKDSYLETPFRLQGQITSFVTVCCQCACIPHVRHASEPPIGSLMPSVTRVIPW